MSFTDKIKGIGLPNLLIISLLSILFSFSALQVADHGLGFSITSASFRPRSLPGWYLKGDGDPGFLPINLPSFDRGYYLINFSSDENTVDVRMYTYPNSCIGKVYLDGIILSEYPCSTNISMSLEGLGGGGAYHMLALETRKVETDEAWEEVNGFLQIERAGTDFFWRVSALLCLSSIIWFLFLAMRGVSLAGYISKSAALLRDNRHISLMIVCAIIIRLLIMPSYMSVDLRYWALIFTENLVHKSSLDFTVLDPEYTVFHSECFMSHPPGWTPYSMAIIRLLFGFNWIYLTYLTKLPPLIGDLMIAYVIWSVGKAKMRSSHLHLILAVFLFNPAFIMNTAYQGKADSLCLGFLMLAVKNIKKKRFSVYYALSLVCKQLPIFLLPWFLFNQRIFKKLAYAGLIVLLLLSPYLYYDPILFFDRMTKTHLFKTPEGFTWINNLKGWSSGQIIELTSNLFLAYLMLVILISLYPKTRKYHAGALVYGLFIIFNRVVYEQYLLWTLPFMLMVYILEKDKAVLSAYMLISFSYLLSFESSAMLDRSIFGLWNIFLALIVAYTMLDLFLGLGRMVGDEGRS
ncbi:hypothetical protein ACFLRF_01425 [Candidatus Altiarchaeota archaeon]